MKLSDIKPVKDINSHFYISLKNDYLFHSVGKAANSTVKHFLYTEELKGSGIKCNTVHDRISSPLLSPFQIKNSLFFDIVQKKDYFKFTFVRNPYSRIVSCYLDRIVQKKSAAYRSLLRFSGKSEGYDFTFDEFVSIIVSQSDYEANNHWRLQYADCCCEVIDYDFVGRQESFSKDMEKVFKKIYPDAPLPDFGNINASPSKSNASSLLDKYWNDRLLLKFNERYAKDFSFFGYSFI